MEKFLLISLILCLSVSGNLFAQQEDANSLYEKCKLAYAKGNFASAKEDIDRFLSLYPDAPNADEVLFIQAFLQPSIYSSMQGYQQIIEKYPQSKWIAKAHFQLGQLYYFLSDYDKALENFGRIIVSYSDDDIYWTTRYWRCKVLIAKKDYDGAISALSSLAETAVREIGKDVILMALANCYVAKGEHENAVAAYRSLIEKSPGSSWVPTAYIAMAKSLEAMGKGEEGKPFLQKMLATYPDSIEAQQAKEMLASPSPSVDTKDKEEPMTMEKESTPVKAVTGKPASTETSGPYYSLQVGAFSLKEKADGLAKDLMGKGYYVDVIDVSSRGRTIYKVRVGKFKTESEANKLAQTLRAREGLDTILVYE